MNIVLGVDGLYFVLSFTLVLNHEVVLGFQF
jgi:hypothetical protein